MLEFETPCTLKIKLKILQVGHTFYLGDKYSKSLNANYLDLHNKHQTLQMGSYGIGVSRLLAASLECLSLEQELRWPDTIAPYNVAIIPPKVFNKLTIIKTNVINLFFFL